MKQNAISGELRYKAEDCSKLSSFVRVAFSFWDNLFELLGECWVFDVVLLSHSSTMEKTVNDGDDKKVFVKGLKNKKVVSFISSHWRRFLHENLNLHALGTGVESSV